MLQTVRAFSGVQSSLDADKFDFTWMQNAAVLTHIQLCDPRLGRSYAAVAGARLNPIALYFDGVARKREGDYEGLFECMCSLLHVVSSLRCVSREGIDRARIDEERTYFNAGPWFFANGLRAESSLEFGEGDLDLGIQGELLLLLLPHFKGIEDQACLNRIARLVIEMRDVEIEVIRLYANMADLCTLFATLKHESMSEESGWSKWVFSALATRIKTRNFGKEVNDCAALLANTTLWRGFSEVLREHLATLLQNTDRPHEDLKAAISALLTALFRGHSRRGEQEKVALSSPSTCCSCSTPSTGSSAERLGRC